MSRKRKKWNDAIQPFLDALDQSKALDGIFMTPAHKVPSWSKFIAQEMLDSFATEKIKIDRETQNFIESLFYLTTDALSLSDNSNYSSSVIAGMGFSNFLGMPAMIDSRQVVSFTTEHKPEPMTEQEWLTSVNPHRMLNFTCGNDMSTFEGIGNSGYILSSRKLRLFACAVMDLVYSCERRFGTSIPNGEKEVEVAYLFADAQASQQELEDASHFTMLGPCRSNALYAALLALSATNSPEWQSELLRCIFGNPFKSVKLSQPEKFGVAESPHWLTLNVQSITRAIYDTHHFYNLPVLADALEEAGCDNNDIFAHCREKGPHCRGCWVVDLLLGKM